MNLSIFAGAAYSPSHARFFQIDSKQKTKTPPEKVDTKAWDNAGYLIEQGGFEVLNLPAIAPRIEIYDLGGGRNYVRQHVW